MSAAGLLDQAHEHLKEAVYLYGRVCDDLHPEACHCHSLLARVAFLRGKTAEVSQLLTPFNGYIHTLQWWGEPFLKYSSFRLRPTLHVRLRRFYMRTIYN